jgi:hypothetical protein
VGGWRLVPGRPVHHGDRGQLAPQRRGPTIQVGEKEGHGLGAGRQRVDGMRGAPGAEGSPVGGVGAQGRRSARGFGIGAGPFLEDGPGQGRPRQLGRRHRRHASESRRGESELQTYMLTSEK